MPVTDQPPRRTGGRRQAVLAACRSVEEPGSAPAPQACTGGGRRILLRQRWFTLCCGVILLAGCGRTVPVTGTVSFQSAPLAGATVVLTGSAAIAVGITDASGEFTLRSRVAGDDLPGALPGDYRVTISKFVPPGGMTEADYAARLEKAHEREKVAGYNPVSPVPPRVELLPDTVSDAAKTGLRATVRAGEKNRLTFALP